MAGRLDGGVIVVDEVIVRVACRGVVVACAIRLLCFRHHLSFLVVGNVGGLLVLLALFSWGGLA
eukprot:10394785-Alexandrium_andersonii.AAC.1